MNLNYTIQQIAKWTEAKILGPQNATVNSISIDSRSPIIHEGTLFIALNGHKTDGHLHAGNFVEKGGHILLVERDISLPNVTQIVVKDTLKALQTIAMEHRKQFDIPVIGITGSNGKTTVKEWLYHLLSKQYHIVRSPKSYNSQIGVPLSVLELHKGHNLAIFEAGISQPGEMENLANIIQPTIGVFTGIGDAHQANFNSLETKQQEKFKLFKSIDTVLTTDGTNPEVNRLIPFKDEAAQLNAALAYKVALFVSRNTHHDAIKQALKSLPEISMRMERMEGNRNNIIINDTYTFDEKGLEIGLQYLNDNKKNRKKVVILAPAITYTPTDNLVKIIEASHVNQLIWIHPQTLTLGNTDINQFKTVDQFIKSGIVFENAILLFSGSRTMALEKSLTYYVEKKHVTRLEIDLTAIRDNLNQYRKNLPSNTAILAMVKAQSYGGGIVEMAHFLNQEKVNYLGVAYSDEGSTLREADVQLPILVMNPEENAFDDITANNLEPSIYSVHMLNRFLHHLILKGIRRYPIHIKLDTGMHRLGFQEQDLQDLINTLNAQPEVYVKSVFSHLAVADDFSERPFTEKQIDQFNTFSTAIEKGIGYRFIRHIANSEGALNYTSAHFDMVRIGIGLFGLVSNHTKHFVQALSFKTEVSQIKIINDGESVGYGRQFKSTGKTIIGIIPVGYADGLSRQLSNGKWHVKINDTFVPIIGSVCMDMCMINLTGINASVGDAVEIFGWENSIQSMANTLSTIPYEIISSISSRVHRVYVD